MTMMMIMMMMVFINTPQLLALLRQLGCLATHYRTGSSSKEHYLRKRSIRVGGQCP